MGDGLTFDPATHTYYRAGIKVPGVTEVLESQGLVQLHGPPAALRAARDLGTAVHKATMEDDQGRLDDESVHPSVWPYLYAWRAFREEWGFEPEEIEASVYHQTYNYAGTPDRIGRSRAVKSGYCLADIKSGAKRKATGPQTAAYLHARFPKPGDRKKYQRFGVYLHDDATYEAVPYDDPNDWYAFAAALTLYNWKGKNL